MTDEEYNGWSNRETWAISLHLGNNEGDYNYMRSQARDFVESNAEEEDSRSCAIGDMAEFIKNWTTDVFESVLYPDDNNLASQEARMLVSDVGSNWRADWYEIAEHWIDEAIEEMNDGE